MSFLRARSGHERSFLGPAMPSNPLRWIFLASKAGFACFLALLIDQGVGNPDHVTSTFVAVLCVSPVVLIGLRRSLEQIAGSLIGGIWGTLMRVFGLVPLWGIPLAVAAAVLSCFRLGFGRGYAIAAFTALFVQAVPRGEPSETLVVRMVAVGIGAFSAFVVNLLISSMAYRDIFSRRIRYAESEVSILLEEASRRGPQVVRAGFPMLTDLDRELSQAKEELAWRGGQGAVLWLVEVEERLDALRRLLHLVLDLVYRLEEEALPVDTMQGWLSWLVGEEGEQPEVPDTVAASAERILRLVRDLRQRARSSAESTK